MEILSKKHYKPAVAAIYFVFWGIFVSEAQQSKIGKSNRLESQAVNIKEEHVQLRIPGTILILSLKETGEKLKHLQVR